jgi:uncharacterized protein YuzE
MNFHYDKASDSLYIQLSPNPGFDAEEVSEGVVVDYDKDGHIVGLDIEYASKHLNLANIHVEGFMPKVEVQPSA